jgi:hypothetical protein
MMIVEKPEEAIAFAKETMSADAIASSLPHRSPAEIEQLVSCFIGATTWRTVCEQCAVPWSEIEALEA